MSELPPIVLLLAPGPGPGILAALRQPGGGVRAVADPAGLPVPAGALLAWWPGRFPWTPAAFELQQRVLRTGGACVPLATVLSRLGIGAGRGTAGLTAALAPHLEEVAEPGAWARELAAGLAARLEALPRAAGPAAGGSEAAPGGPGPVVRDALAALPAGPGVYRFLARDGRELYLGKARSLRSRVPRHFGPRPAEPRKSERLVREAADLRYESTGTELEALLREQLGLGRALPPLNTQARVHRRPRGAWRRAALLLALPSAEPGAVEVCLVAGDGRFHWERVRRARRLPRGLWERVGTFLSGAGGGWAPGEPGRPLPPSEASEMAELTLTWLARHGDRPARIDLVRETAGRALMSRIRRLLAEDPAGGRTEVR